MERENSKEKLSLYFVESEQTTVVLEKPSQDTKKIALLIHGFMSNKDSETNMTLTKRLLTQGVATVRFDLYGHGESFGLFQQLTLSRCLHQAEGLIAWIQEKGYTEISLVGSSLGGLIAIHTAAKHPELISLALKCPVSNYPVLWQNRFRQGGMANWEKEGLVSFIFDDQKKRLEYGFYADLLTFNTYADAARIKTRTLIVHGDADEDVPVDQSIRLSDTLRLASSDKALVLISGADHGFEKPDDFTQMIDRIEKWII
jgi:hypothetical protein